MRGWNARTAAKVGAMFGVAFGIFGVAVAGEINGSLLYVVETMFGGALLFAAAAMICNTFNARPSPSKRDIPSSRGPGHSVREGW